MTARATLVRVTLLVVATGALAAFHVRGYLDEDAQTRPDLAFGYGAFLGLTLLAALRRPPAWSSHLAFAVATAVYLWSAVLPGGAVAFPLVLAVVGAVALYQFAAGETRLFVAAGFALWTPAVQLFAGPGAALGPLLVLAAFGAPALLVAVSFRREDRLRRVGLALLGLAIVSAVFERHTVVASLGVAPDDVLGVGALLILAALAFLPTRPRTGILVAAALALGAYVLVGAALLIGKGYHSDAVVAPHRAAELLLAGQNPYAAFDMDEALRRFGVPATLATQMEDGTYLRSLNYPAGSFLVVAPFVAAGIGDIRWVYLGEVVLLIAVVLWRARAPWMPIVAALLVANVPVRRQYVLAGIDPTWALGVVAAWLLFERRWLSALALGLAAATRQPAWFFVPFYFIAVGLALGRAEVLRRAGIAAAAFAALNFPFVLLSPAAYLESTLAPILAPLLPYGVGLVRIFLGLSLEPPPRLIFGLLTVALFTVLLALLWRRWRDLRAGALAFPLVPLFLAWRSLQNYFAFQPVFALVGDEEVVPGGPPSARTTSGP